MPMNKYKKMLSFFISTALFCAISLATRNIVVSSYNNFELRRGFQPFSYPHCFSCSCFSINTNCCFLLYIFKYTQVFGTWYIFLFNSVRRYYLQPLRTYCRRICNGLYKAEFCYVPDIQCLWHIYLYWSFCTYL